MLRNPNYNDLTKRINEIVRAKACESRRQHVATGISLWYSASATFVSLREQAAEGICRLLTQARNIIGSCNPTLTRGATLCRLLAQTR